jgi:cell division protein FtsI (penicillin-binding protein 3)
MTFLAGFVGIALAAVAVRAADLHLVQADALRREAAKQQWREFQSPVWRGPILDRNGAELALTVEVDSVFADPRAVRDPDGTAVALGRTLGVDARALAARLHDRRSFVWVKRWVSPAEVEAVRALRIDGVQTTREPKRFYPGRGLAAQLLGFVGFDSEGLEGLEHEYDTVLRGRPRTYRGVRDARGRMVFVEGLGEVEVPQSQRVDLAIDRTLQFIAEQELEAGMRAFEGKAASVVVMDPRTGEVLALVNAPSFDPNRFGEAEPAARRNRALADRFEPGSTMKIFTVAALLESGILGSEDQVFCEDGLYVIGDYKIRDAHRNGWLTLTQCLQRSSNVCMAKSASVLGRDGLYDMLRRFGFGERTGVPLPGETGGLLRHPSRWYEVDLAAVSFGQGVGVSNLQLATAVSAVANGGLLMQPIVIRRVIGPDGRLVRDFPPTVRRRVISERTARLLAAMLTSVTETGGTGTEARVPGFNVAGKTGTAQKADIENGGYSKEHWTSSFVGFVPADDPRLVISVTVDEPLINHYGGIVAAPIFRRIAERSLRYLGVAAARVPGTPDPVSAAGPPPESAGAHLTVTGMPPTLPAAGMLEVPDFGGETLRAAVRVARTAGIALRIVGSGIAVEQDPAPGTGVAPGTPVLVRFEPAAGGTP